MQQRHRHPVAVDYAQAHGPAARSGGAAHTLAAASLHVLGRQQAADVGAVTHAGHGVFECQRNRTNLIGEADVTVAEDRERLERGDTLGRRREL